MNQIKEHNHCFCFKHPDKMIRACCHCKSEISEQEHMENLQLQGYDYKRRGITM